MVKLDKQKIAAIVPALNEEANVGRVLKVLLGYKGIEEVILVDDGSTDKTAEIGVKLGVKVVRLSKIGGSGKGNAMKQGVMATDADIVVFFDADLIGLTEEHISALIKPMLDEGIEMCVGLRGRLMGLPQLIAKIDPLMAIGGERAVRRRLFKSIPDKLIGGFMVESALNYYCLAKKLSVKYVVLKNIGMVIKEKKWGLVRGFSSRIKMFCQIIKIRLIIIFNKNEFIQKDNAR